MRSGLTTERPPEAFRWLPRAPAWTRRVLTVIAAGVGLCGTLAPLSAGAEPTVFQDWTRDCERLGNGASSCHISQNVADPQSGKVVLRAEVGFIPGKERSVLLVTVPLGVDLRPGVALRIDRSAPLRLDYYVCSPDGCRAVIPADQSLVAAMKRGAAARFEVMTLDGRSVDIPLSLMGFTKGYNSL